MEPFVFLRTITVRNLAGSELLSLTITASATLQNLHDVVVSRLDIPPAVNVSLLFGERVLSNVEWWLHDGATMALTLVREPARLVLTSSYDKTAKLWNANTGVCFLTFEGHTDVVNSATFSPDGASVLTASRDGTAKIWNSTTGDCLLSFGRFSSVLPSWGFNSGRFSPDGASVVTASENGMAQIFCSSTGDCLLTFGTPAAIIIPGSGMMMAAFSPDGASVLTASDDRMAKIWSSSTGDCFLILSGHQEEVVSGEFSSDGSLALTASEDSTAKIWDSSTGACLVTLFGHGAALHSAVFSSDRASVLTTSEDGTARLWSAALWSADVPEELMRSGAVSLVRQSLRTLVAPMFPWMPGAADGGRRLDWRDGGSFWTAAFSSDGTEVLTGNSRGAVAIWAQRGAGQSDFRHVWTFYGHSAGVTSCIFSR